MSSDSSKERQGFEAVNRGETDEASLVKKLADQRLAAFVTRLLREGRKSKVKPVRKRQRQVARQDDAEVGDGRQRAKIRARDGHNIQRD